MEAPGVKPVRGMPVEKEFSMVKKSARRIGRTRSPAFKAQAALVALRDDNTIPIGCTLIRMRPPNKVNGAGASVLKPC